MNLSYMGKDIFNQKPNKNHFDDDDKIKFKKPVYVKDDLEAFNRLFKSYSKLKQNYRKKDYIFFGGKIGSAYKIREQNQRVMFKMSYSHSMASHDKYRKYYMPQINKDYVAEKPELFGMSDEEYEQYKTPLNFKCIISPESQNINLQTLVKSFIKRIEYQTGYKLVWQSCIHNDTPHRHAHVVINGKDRNGDEIYFNKDMIQLMRFMCENAATQMIGERTSEQIEAARKNYITAKRWSVLDEKMELVVRENNFSVSRKNLIPEYESRFSYLAELKLAKIDWKENSWQVSKEYKNILQAAGRYNSYLEEYCKNPEQPLILYTGGRIKGKVEKVISFDKDESWNDALIINTGKNRIYIPVWQLQKDDLQGKTVSICKTGDETKIAQQVSDKNINIID